MMSLVPVLFRARYGSYNAGEVGGVPPEVAEQLIAAGHAAAYSPTGAVQPEPEKEPEPTGDAPVKAKGKK